MECPKYYVSLLRTRQNSKDQDNDNKRMTLGKQIRAISFDLDGTLCDFSLIMVQTLKNTLGELASINQSAAEALDIISLIATRDQTALDLGQGASHEEIRLEAFNRSLESVGASDPELVAHLYGFYMRHRFDDLEPYPDVKPVLDYLKGKYLLGVISNGNSYPDRIGLDGYFDFIVLSQDYGFRKPDSRLFTVALREAGCKPHEMIHVGDSLENDVQGANKAGLISVYMNRNKLCEDTDAGFAIGSLMALKDILGY